VHAKESNCCIKIGKQHSFWKSTNCWLRSSFHNQNVSNLPGRKLAHDASGTCAWWRAFHTPAESPWPPCIFRARSVHCTLCCFCFGLHSSKSETNYMQFILFSWFCVPFYFFIIFYFLMFPAILRPCSGQKKYKTHTNSHLNPQC